METNEITVSAIGLGNRGREYLTIIKRFANGAKIAALCDIKPQALDDVAPALGVPSELRFSDPDSFFAAGRLSDALIIATQDATHYSLCRRAIALGYDILLEKPVSTNLDECKTLEKEAAERGVKLVVCHVMRYSSFYKTIKGILQSGRLGKVLTVDHIENVGWFHFAHSYVRGNWKCEKTSTPSLLAKCCHDIDMISWLIGERCTDVCSYGSLSWFRPENAPQGAADRCLDCRVENCPYNAEKLYITNPFWKWNVVTSFSRRVVTGKAKATRADMYEALRVGDYGRCVFRSGNDVCDHQVVAMQFEGGATVVHTLNALSGRMERQSHIVCEKGELTARGDRLWMQEFGKRRRRVFTGFLKLPGHLEADFRTALAFVKLVQGRLDSTENITFISSTIPSHDIVMAAERYRKQNPPNGER